MINTPWSSIGYITYKRTYSRVIEGSDRTEEFPETIERVITACNQQLNCKFTKEEEERLRYYFLSLKGSVAGRFLWQLGTDTVNRFGLASLQNCAFTVVDKPIVPFTWTMDMLALGAGVGYNIQREHVNKIPAVRDWFKIPTRIDNGSADFIIPDSREGWVRFLAKTLKAAFLSERKDKGSFTYSTQVVRGKGLPIKGFGGTSSGPEALVVGINKISNVLLKRAGRKVRPIDCLDMMNIIGEVIVAGNVRRCIPQTSKIFYKGGLTTIKDIEIGEEVLTSEGYHKVINKFAQGIQETIIIKTQDGSFECTPNHKMAVMTGVDEYKWKEAQELKIDDRLITSRIPIEGTETQLPEGLEITPVLDADLAWLIGVFHGNGYVYLHKEGKSNGHITIEFNDKDIKEIIFTEEQFKRFGFNVSTRHDDRQASIRINSHSIELARYFYKYIKQPNTPIIIPNWIINSKQEIKLAYLAGIFDTDGSRNHTPVRLVTTIYPEFAKSVQLLCYSCGLETRLAGPFVSKEINKQDTYEVDIINDYVKDVFHKVPQLCKIMRKGTRDCYTNTYLQGWLTSHGFTLNSGGYNREVAIRKFTDLTGEYPDLLPVKVVGIEKGRSIETFDIEVETMNEFFCEGYLTHNSAQLALFDEDDIECLLAKRFDLSHVPSHRAMSNNSVVCEDISNLHEYFWDTYQNKGEPIGIVNLRLSREIGRLGEIEYPDPEVMGYNPKQHWGLRE